jgi:POT family proton-dependent oligopeptide transporter
MLGLASLAVSAASLISGRMGGLYERVSPEAFWAINAGVVGGTGLALLALAPILRKQLASA